MCCRPAAAEGLFGQHYSLPIGMVCLAGTQVQSGTSLAYEQQPDEWQHQVAKIEEHLKKPKISIVVVGTTGDVIITGRSSG